MKRFIAPLIIGIIDTVLLLVIILSGPASASSGAGTTEYEGRTSASRETAEVRTKESSSKRTEDAETRTAAKPETSETRTAAEPEAETTAFDMEAYDTYERPTLADFEWVTMDILKGDVPEDEPVYFSQILGGWKCYILDDPESGAAAERLLNVTIDGTPENITLTFDWYYTHNYRLDEGYDDNTPDSVFTGAVNEDGYIETLGAGKAVLTDFYAQDGHLYAIGMMSWPDGVKGYIAIVRP